ncbi:hypothetical protein BN946_scf184926.g6 [Trametes cinnabarina]|uniref:Uncharacterized protein n=1 Tax=Pycnoporus cinnabarinus TaxID=5643 RepID=A0A060SZ69_PYCCI|nr:hypothetical protein BN946_scf184926.g6 [Trametes cinnabarina]
MDIDQSDEDPLGVQQQRFAARVHEEQNMAELIRGTYRESWNEFYRQETVQSAGSIRSLASASPCPPLPLSDYLSADEEFDSTTRDASARGMTANILHLEKKTFSVLVLRNDLELSGISSWDGMMWIDAGMDPATVEAFKPMTLLSAPSAFTSLRKRYAAPFLDSV